MTFEEFFNKKRIDLVALKATEPGLFAEFEKHFTQMGEKSFDHTKKYWFNKLRLQYHLAPGLKPEKMHQENQLAEQTIVETLTDSIPAPSAGFKPRFKPGVISKPTEPTPANEHEDTLAIEQPAIPETEKPAEPTAQKPSFKPRFNAKMAAPKPADAEEVKPETEPAAETSTSPETIAPTPGFKPRFNMKMAAPKPAAADEAKPEAEPTTESADPAPSGAPAPKPGFKPRFNMKAMAAKPVETEVAESEAEPAKETAAAPSTETTATKPGFKPRFNMKMVTPKPAEDIVQSKEEAAPEAFAEDKPAEIVEPTPPAELAAPKIGFKPRFNAKTTKPQTPPEE